MEINNALQEIDDLINSEVHMNQNFKSYLKRKFSENGVISHKEFELIEKTIRLFLISLINTEIRLLWKQIETGENSHDSDKYEAEINSAKNDLETELLVPHYKI